MTAVAVLLAGGFTVGALLAVTWHRLIGDLNRTILDHREDR